MTASCRGDCAEPACQSLCQPASLLAYGVLATGATAPACPAGLSANGPALYSQIDATRNTCHGCTCDAPSACVSSLRAYNQAGCNMGGTGQDASYALTSGTTCQNIAIYPYYWLDPPKIACAPIANSPAPDPAWKQ